MTIPRLTTALAGRYAIERELGAGGMATVYLARDLKHEREVALKVLRPELGAVLGAERFLAEIKITARLDHPHILTLIDSGEADGFLFYVLPFVRGESLRERLDREKQLSIEEAVAITKQVAGALDYAHRQGVVHRDIKPENILLQEGEAMLADFGIALAVKEAGGNRLTETGLSLGTPQYMSPEQATGDRMLDARSDVYSLAAVLYEMLAGEPPVTGPTAQAMIAKLMTERPTHLRVVRQSVPEPIEAAVARALDKTPADRFSSAGDFVRALEVRGPGARQGPAPGPRRWLIGVTAATVLVVAAAGGLMASGKLGNKRGPVFVLRDRTQLTTSGAVLTSAISPDGKQLAYFTRHCSGASCEYAIDLQDVGGTTTRRLLDHATSVYGLSWSPDRRNLIVVTTLNGRWGAYLLSALGGAPRYLGPGPATFWAGGDSLLIGPAGNADSVFYIRVTSIDGAGRDSVRVTSASLGSFAGIAVTPNGRWMIPLVVQDGRGLWQVVSREGKVTDRVLNSCTCPGLATTDALWVERAGGGTAAIVRLALDQGSGKLAERQDTVFSGAFNGFSVTADGSALVIDDGTSNNSVWALDVANALKGEFPDSRRVIQASTRVSAAISPDGARLLVRRTMPSSTGSNEVRLSVMPFEGGNEVPLATEGLPRGSGWVDSVNVLVTTYSTRGLHAAVLDARTGTPGRSVDLDSSTVYVVPLDDGWAWIPSTRDRIVIQRGADTVTVAKPAWFESFAGLDKDPHADRLVVTGWNAGTNDSLAAAVVPLAGGVPVRWVTMFAEFGTAQFAPDGSLGWLLHPTQESVALYRVRGPGAVEGLGTVARPVAIVTVSRDLQRATVLESDYHGDAWMQKVVRP
jgi:hypothetical protein